MVSLWATFKSTPGRLPWRSRTYALVRAVQARVRQQMNALKVAKRDTEGLRPTAETRRGFTTTSARVT